VEPISPGLHKRSIQDRLANRSESKAASRSWGTSVAGESEQEGDHAEQIKPCRIVRGRPRFIKKSSCVLPARYAGCRAGTVK